MFERLIHFRHYARACDWGWSTLMLCDIKSFQERFKDNLEYTISTPYSPTSTRATFECIPLIQHCKGFQSIETYSVRSKGWGRSMYKGNDLGTLYLQLCLLYVSSDAEVFIMYDAIEMFVNRRAKWRLLCPLTIYSTARSLQTDFCEWCQSNGNNSEIDIRFFRGEAICWAKIF